MTRLAFGHQIGVPACVLLPLAPLLQHSKGKGAGVRPYYSLSQAAATALVVGTAAAWRKLRRCRSLRYRGAIDTLSPCWGMYCPPHPVNGCIAPESTHWASQGTPGSACGMCDLNAAGETGMPYTHHFSHRSVAGTRTAPSWPAFRRRPQEHMI